MKKDIAEKWVADLRTNPDKQTRGALFDGKGYCCLGRLCLVLGKYFVKSSDAKYWEIEGTNESGILTGEISDEAGMYDRSGVPHGGEGIKISGEIYHQLSEANDGGATFNEIADWIEQNWERL